MILSVHLLTGAAIASKIQIIPLAFFLAFLSHYFLDFLPHGEYSVKNIKERKWRKSFPDFLKISLDISAGLLIIFLLTDSWQAVIYLAALFAILPDFFTFWGIVFNNKFKLLVKNDRLHRKIHFYFQKKKKLPFFWNFFIQSAVLIAAALLLVL